MSVSGKAEFGDGKKLHKLVGDHRRPRVTLPKMKAAINIKPTKKKTNVG